MQLQQISTIDKIIAWERFAKEQPQVEIKIDHYFSHGVYARAIQIPANTILTGEIHKHENLNILVKGKIKVSIGDEIEIIEAPFIIVSPPGTKRIAHTITECLWVTIHGTFKKNLDEIREEFIASSMQEWLEFSNSNQLELPLFIDPNNLYSNPNCDIEFKKVLK